MDKIALTRIVLIMVVSCASAAGTLKPEILETWRNYKYGMFIHYGMSTFTGREMDPGDRPSTTYAPTNLDVDQWIRVARDAGMKYAVLTSKHVAGHCLWDSKVQLRGKEFDYDIATSSDKTDVIAEYVKACKKYTVAPGLYWCMIDTHNTGTPPGTGWAAANLPDDFYQFARAQLAELIRNYPEIGYYWLDLPRAVSLAQRQAIYDMIKQLRPNTVVLYNYGFAGKDVNGAFTVESSKGVSWPTDVLNSERYPINAPFNPEQSWQGKIYNLGYEHCDTLCQNWFWVPGDSPRATAELYQLYSGTRAAGGNLLLDVPPDRSGRIPEASVKALMDLKQVIDHPSMLTLPPDQNGKASAPKASQNEPVHGLGVGNEAPLPSDLDCVAQPAYRHRPDGKPGREITVNFKGAKVLGDARMDVTVNGITETVGIVSVDGGAAGCRVLLPDGVAVDAEAPVTLTLRQGSRNLTKMIKVPPMRHWTVYLYSHAHVDIGYTNTQKNVEILHKTNIIEGIKLGEETNGYSEGAKSRWNPEVTWPIERLWVTMPEQRDSVLKAIRNGSLCIDAGYLNLNTSVCSEEELFQILRFSREMQDLTGVPMDTFQQMDIPGMTWGLVPVMAQQGVKYIMSWPNTERAGRAHADGIDGKPFWWVGPDGTSKVLFLQPGNYGNSDSMAKGRAVGRPWFGQRDPAKVPPRIQTGGANVNFIDKVVAQEKKDNPFDFIVLSWSLWDNCPIDADVPAAVKAWNEQYAYPKIVIAGGHEIMAMIEQKFGDRLPVVKGDYTEYWTDGLGAAAGLTAINRNAREKLTQAETLWTMLHHGDSAPRDGLNEAWRYIALGSEHTWCAENPKEPYFQNAIWKVKQQYFREADDRAQAMFDEALAPATNKSDGALGSADGPANGGIAVFNTHSWAHGGLVTLDASESGKGDRVTDEQGKDVPAQRLSSGSLAFLASDVPAFGSRHYRVLAGICPLTDGCKVNGTTMENGRLQVTLDSATGNITRLVDVTTGRNFANPEVNGGLNAFRWLPANKMEPVADTGIAITTVENGPLVVDLCVTSKATGCRTVSRSVRLVNDRPWAEISNIVDKLPHEAKDGIHFGFGFDIPHGRTRFDIPWGVVEVEKDQFPQANRNWFTVQRWLDVSNDKEGVTWCSLDAPLFESGDMTANISTGWGEGSPLWRTRLETSSTVYSWVMNNHWHTNFPLTQDGPVTFRYCVRPHDSAFDAAAANRFGHEQSQPLAHVATNINPNLKPLVAIDNNQCCITILKPAAIGKPTIVRVRSLSDKPETTRLSWPAGTPKSVRVCTLDESPGDPAGETLSLLPYGMLTISVDYNIEKRAERHQKN